MPLILNVLNFRGSDLNTSAFLRGKRMDTPKTVYVYVFY